MSLKLYHVTSAEAVTAIMRSGFRDASGFYMTPVLWSGVFLSDRPLDPNEGTNGNTILLVTLAATADEIAQFEWIEDGKPYREFCMPAKLINERGIVRVLNDDESLG